MNEINNKKIAVFQSSDNEIEFQVVIDNNEDTVWATQHQIIELFGKSRRTIGEHIKNIYSEGELDVISTRREFRQVQKEGNREVTRLVGLYNLDVIISVGYRVKSQRGIEFRKWATKRLKEYLIEGYSINKELLDQQNLKIKNLEKTVDLLNEKYIANQNIITDGFLSIISKYSRSFVLLNQFDSGTLNIDNLQHEIIYVVNYNDVKLAISQLKKDLIKKNEATNLFGNEKDDSFKGILGSISQTIFGQLAYPSIEEQAAQLLYSIIKGHAFSDGNKRIGSFIFVWFLEQNNFHFNKNGEPKITENTLVALALATAQSLPDQRDLIVKLIISLIKE